MRVPAFMFALVAALMLAVPAWSQVNEMARVSEESRSYILLVFADQAPVQQGVSRGSAQLIRNANGQLRILTNQHVVGSAKKVWVQFRGTLFQEVAVLGVDKRADLALLAAPAYIPPYVRPIEFARDQPEIGDVVYAIGYPLGGYNISYGRVSSLAAPIGLRSMTHQAPLTVGNSGGALVRLNERGEGELIGINTAISAGDGNMSYFVPAYVAQKLLEKLERGPVVHAIMGIGLADTLTVDPYTYRNATGLPYPPQRQGVLILAVGEGSSAARAGVRAGDLVVMCEAFIAGEWRVLNTTNSTRFSDEVFFSIDPGTRGRLKIARGEETLTFEFEFGAASPM